MQVQRNFVCYSIKSGSVCLPIHIMGFWETQKMEFYNEQLCKYFLQVQGNLSREVWQVVCETKQRYHWVNVLTVNKNCTGILNTCDIYVHIWELIMHWLYITQKSFFHDFIKTSMRLLFHSFLFLFLLYQQKKRWFRLHAIELFEIPPPNGILQYKYYQSCT